MNGIDQQKGGELVGEYPIFLMNHSQIFDHTDLSAFPFCAPESKSCFRWRRVGMNFLQDYPTILSHRLIGY